MKRHWTKIVLAMLLALPMMISLGGCIVEDRGYHDHWFYDHRDGDHRDWDHHDDRWHR